jgi:hypothetical protein
MKTFLSLMTEQRNRPPQDVKNDLESHFYASSGIKCPVPGCTCATTFLRWGSLWDHFLDAGHKKDFFSAYTQKFHRPFCDPSGEGFKHGVRALMLAMITQPTSLVSLQATIAKRRQAKETAFERPKKTRPVQEQQLLLSEEKEAPETLVESLAPALKAVATATSSSFSKKSSFSQLSELIREEDEINVRWRGREYAKYVKMFHGIPPCFHCRSAEGKQIHHQNPLFHEIILISLNKLATTAEEVMKEGKGGWRYNSLLQEVVSYHFEDGAVLAVPYCQECNQDAEAKRRKSR